MFVNEKAPGEARLSTKALGLTEAELAALIEVRNDLATGRIKAPNFCMSSACYREGCGTVACIGGWMGLKLGMDERKARDFVDNPRLEKLFYPYGIMSWGQITPSQAVRAIDNFLATGDPNWSQACQEL